MTSTTHIDRAPSVPEITRTLREALRGERGGNMPVPIADLRAIVAALEAATHAPGPGPLRNVDFWAHHPDCKPLERCRCGLSEFRAAMAP